MSTPDLMDTPRSNALFSAIVATVAARGGCRITLRELAARIGVNESVTAQCIALHRYLRMHAGELEGAMTFPPPPDFTVPQPDDEIDETALGIEPMPPEPARL